MSQTKTKQVSGKIIKIWFRHRFSFREAAVEVAKNLNDDHGDIYGISEVVDGQVKRYLIERLTEIEETLILIQDVNNCITCFRNERDADSSEYERMIRRRNKQYLDELNEEWLDIHDELKLINAKPEEEENWDTV